MVCLLTSATCHLFGCCAAHITAVMWRFDYAGIAVLIVASFFPPVYYGAPAALLLLPLLRRVRTCLCCSCCWRWRRCCRGFLAGLQEMPQRSCVQSTAALWLLTYLYGAVPLPPSPQASCARPGCASSTS